VRIHRGSAVLRAARLYADASRPFHPTFPDSGAAEISFIDIKHEIDPGDAHAMAWLEHELPVVQRDQHSTISTYLDDEFSVGSGTKVADWTPARANSGATLTWDDAVGHASAGSVLLSDTKASAAGNPSFVAAPVVQPTTVGQTFEMTAWAEGTNATGQNRIAICWFTADGGYLSESDSPILPTGTTNWQQLQVTSSAPSGAAYELIYLESGDNSGTVHFDDVTFTEEG
jgi:hypothetical protein